MHRTVTILNLQVVILVFNFRKEKSYSEETMEKVCDGCKSRRSDLTDKELALFGAASNGHQNCMEVLLNAGADVNAIEHQYNTVLAVASAKGNPECVKLLLKAGADVNGSGEWLDYRALMAASGSGQAECM